MRPKRTDDKYWTGTRSFNHIQYESDLEDYIIDLEKEAEKLRLGNFSYCACEKPTIIYTAHPLPDICNYYRNAIKAL